MGILSLTFLTDTKVVVIKQGDYITLKEQKERKSNPGGQQIFEGWMEVVEQRKGSCIFWRGMKRIFLCHVNEAKGMRIVKIVNHNTVKYRRKF